jgi:hypothetical protein
MSMEVWRPKTGDSRPKVEPVGHVDLSDDVAKLVKEMKLEGEESGFNKGYNTALREAKQGTHKRDGIYNLEHVEEFHKGCKAQAVEDLEPMLLEALKGISGVYRLPLEAHELHKVIMEKLNLPIQ